MRLTSTTMTFVNETVPEGTMLAGYAALQTGTHNLCVPV